jgi:hypothetical protein
MSSRSTSGSLNKRLISGTFGPRASAARWATRIDCGLLKLPHRDDRGKGDEIADLSAQVVRRAKAKPALWRHLTASWRLYLESRVCLAERVGFEPTLRRNRKPDFESGAFDHSATSPFYFRHLKPNSYGCWRCVPAVARAKGRRARIIRALRPRDNRYAGNYQALPSARTAWIARERLRVYTYTHAGGTFHQANPPRRTESPSSPSKSRDTGDLGP